MYIKVNIFKYCRNILSIGKRVLELRKKKGVTQSQLSELLGVTSVAVSRWENNLNSPRDKIIVQLADFFEVNPDWLRTGEKKKGQYITVDVPYFGHVSVAAGDGCCIQLEEQTGVISIHKSSLINIVSMKNIVCINVSGSSMEPVINNKGLVAIDLGQKNIKDGNIYVFCQSDNLRIKKIFKMPLGLKFVSYNKEFEDEFYTHDELSKDPSFDILGLAIWYSSTFS